MRRALSLSLSLSSLPHLLFIFNQVNPHRSEKNCFPIFISIFKHKPCDNCIINYGSYLRLPLIILFIFASHPSFRNRDNKIANLQSVLFTFNDDEEASACTPSIYHWTLPLDDAKTKKKKMSLPKNDEMKRERRKRRMGEEKDLTLKNANEAGRNVESSSPFIARGYPTSLKSQVAWALFFTLFYSRTWAIRPLPEDSSTVYAELCRELGRRKPSHETTGYFQRITPTI